MIYKIIVWALALILFVFAAFQINDKDAILWVFIYAAAGIMVLYNLYFEPRKMRFPSIALSVLYLIMAFIVWPSDFSTFTGDMKSDPSVEPAREAAGLFISSVFIGLAVFLRGRV